MPGMLAAAFHSMKGLTFKSKMKLKKKTKSGFKAMQNLRRSNENIKSKCSTLPPVDTPHVGASVFGV